MIASSAGSETGLHRNHRGCVYPDRLANHCELFENGVCSLQLKFANHSLIGRGHTSLTLLDSMNTTTGSSCNG